MKDTVLKITISKEKLDNAVMYMDLFDEVEFDECWIDKQL